MINNRNFESGTFSKKSGRYEKYIQIGIEVLGEHQKKNCESANNYFCNALHEM